MLSSASCFYFRFLFVQFKSKQSNNAGLISVRSDIGKCVCKKLTSDVRQPLPGFEVGLHRGDENLEHE